MKNTIAATMVPLSMWFGLPDLSLAEEIRHNADAINLAGKQRMYTMRMLRDYLMIGEKLDYQDPKADLQKISTAFESTGKALRGYVDDPVLRSEMRTIHKSWLQSRQTFGHPPKKEEALGYAKAALAFRDKLDALVQHLLEHYKSDASEALNTAAGLRATSQAIAALYQLKSWGIPEADALLKKPITRFRQSLDYLNKAGETGEPMKPILAKLERIYLYFQIMGDSDDTVTPALVIKETEKMLKLADTLTSQYVALHKK